MPFSTLKRVCSCPYLSRSLSGVPAGTPKCILSDTRCMDGVLLAFQGAGKISIDCPEIMQNHLVPWSSMLRQAIPPKSSHELPFIPMFII